MLIRCGGETLSALSARYALPGCMILRANRVFSAGWLTPGRELIIPDRDFCEKDDFPCPYRALYTTAKERESHNERISLRD